MKFKNPIWRVLFTVNLFLAASCLVSFTAEAQGLLRTSRRGANAAQPASADAGAGEGDAFASAAEEDGDKKSDLNFRNAELDQIFMIYGRLVGRTVLPDPQTPKLTLTFQSRRGQSLSKEEQIEALEVLLEMNGIHMEPYGEQFTRAIPRKEARKEGIPLYLDPEDPEIAAASEGRVISVNIPFKNITTEEAQKALEGFKSGNGLLQVFERTNSIVVTDTRQNIDRMNKIAKMIDIATPVLEIVEVIQIKNASATDVQAALQKIVEDAMKYQEKDGKAQQNAQNSANRTVNLQPTGSLLRRPGANNTPAPAPANVESLITSVSDADRGMIRGRVLIVPDERSNKLIIVTNKSNMEFFRKVIAAIDVETTPDTQVKVYRLKYADAEDVADMINDLIGNSANSKGNSRQNQNQNARNGQGGNLTRTSGVTPQPRTTNASVNQRSGEAKAGELSKDNTTVLADKRINGLVVMTQKELVPTIEHIIESMDVRLSQVLIETVIIEVGLGDGIETGVDWISRGKSDGSTTVQRTNERGEKLFYASRDTKDADGNIVKMVTSEIVPEGYSSTDKDGNSVSASSFGVFDVVAKAARDAAAGFINGAGNAYSMGGGAFGGTSAAVAMVTNVVDSFAKSGFNAVFKSDKLNLGAILHAVKTDSRSKYIASPVVMTVDNKEAVIEATEMRYLFKGYQYSGSTYSGSPVKDYEQKDLGIKIKVTPKINPNGTVMLKVEEEYSQEGSGQMVDGESQATTVTRKMSADVVLENDMTVIFGGLTQTINKESESGIPILKDIPWIGKWLFSSRSHEESRSELLVFMTPYVLDDAEMAQAEALRRKNAISDSRPWDDHGWSASALADPVAKKEVMRRLKDEAKKQDEERQTKRAIEQWKMDRARALEKMDSDERKFWINAHREELEKEEKERFDAEVKSQSDLKLLATQIREHRLEQAEAKLEENAELLAAENEHGRLAAEKAKAESEPAAEPSIGLSDLASPKAAEEEKGE